MSSSLCFHCSTCVYVDVKLFNVPDRQNKKTLASLSCGSTTSHKPQSNLSNKW